VIEKRKENRTQECQELRIFVGDKPGIKAFFVKSDRTGVTVNFDKTKTEDLYPWDIIWKNNIRIRHYPPFPEHMIKVVLPEIPTIQKQE
jgi:hypothetical protein